MTTTLPKTRDGVASPIPQSAQPATLPMPLRQAAAPGLPRTMRALVKAAAAPGLELRQVPAPEIGPRDVLIKVRKAAICGTDVHIYEWDPWAAGRVQPGTVIGHEFMGEVAAVGDAVTSIAVGDRVSGEGHIGCGQCYACRTGQGHICDRVDIIGIDVNGCFADFVRLPDSNVWQLHDSISDTIGAIHDPLGNAMHTVMVDDVSGQSVLVVGAGPVGLMITTIARAAGAIDIVTLDVNPKRLALATGMGADAAFDPREPNIEQTLLARTRGGRGFDVMLEASGNPSGIAFGIKLLRSGGWAALLGIPSSDVSFNLANDVIFKGVTLHGVNGRRMYETWYQVESFLLHGRIDPSPVITHTLPMEEYARAFDLLRAGDAIKIVLDVNPAKPKCTDPPQSTQDLNGAR
ncbi:MAG TPA: L-threonine 3-dehydrogenase [Chloroflexota bacterium]|nr:L-threonine 3-dehydrogenase [Chloroflexota bacterium]